jgi:hypothetical protein
LTYDFGMAKTLKEKLGWKEGQWALLIGLPQDVALSLPPENVSHSELL